jgi:hypothetical protein
LDEQELAASILAIADINVWNRLNVAVRNRHWRIPRKRAASRAR